jgi:nucleoside-diphosphate-sugar epimerase
MARIVVTGGSGKAGRAAIRELLEHGHDVLNVDRSPPPAGSPAAPFLHADLTDAGQALEILSSAEELPGADAVVHLAAIPSPAHATPANTFR